jgi:maleate isomerase
MDTNLESRTAPLARQAPAVRHGSRLRLGMLLPAVNTEAEPQIDAMLPPGVTLHTTRLRMVESSSPKELLTMTERIEEGAQLLADAKVEHILFNCTAVTTFAPGLADSIRERITKATGIRASATGDAVAAALAALGAKKIVMITPYLAEVNRNEVEFLAGHGITVLKEHGEGLIYARDFRQIVPASWQRKVMAMRDPTADAYFISCAQARVIEIIAPLEAELGCPVVTSNQAALWQSLRQSGIDDRIAGFGALFQR